MPSLDDYLTPLAEVGMALSALGLPTQNTAALYVALLNGRTLPAPGEVPDSTPMEEVSHDSRP